MQEQNQPSDGEQQEKREAPKNKNAPNPICQVNKVGNSLMVCFSKKGLQGLINGNSIPIRLVDGEKVINFVFMRDQTFNARMRQFVKAEQKAKGHIVDMAQEAVDRKKQDQGDAEA